VISPHGWMDPGNWPRLWKLGGMAFPGHSAASDYVKEWKKYRPKSTPYAFGWGYGADLGGLSHQPDPDKDGKISYPFTSYDGKVKFDRERTGERTFDYDKDGVAHYGLYADWFESLRKLGGDQLAKDMWDGAEAYLDMWERANGIERPGCAPARRAITKHGLGGLRLGEDWEALLHRAGQPQQRERAWSWCVAGKANSKAADVAVLSKSGEVELVGSTARGRSAGGIKVGGLAGLASFRVRDGLAVIGGDGVKWVYALRDRKVRAVAVVSPSLADKPRRLRAAVKRLLAAKATQVTPGFVPSDATAKAVASGAALSGNALGATGNPRLNSALMLLCTLQMSAPR